MRPPVVVTSLLAVVLAPSLLVWQAERERRRGRPVGRGLLRTRTEQAVASFSGRFALPNQRRQEIFHALDTFHRRREPLLEIQCLAFEQPNALHKRAPTIARAPVCQ